MEAVERREDVGRERFRGELEHVIRPREDRVDLAAGLGDGLAHLARDICRELFGVGPEALQSLAHLLEPVAKGYLPPSFSGLVRRGDLRLERRALIVVEAADDALVKGVQDLERHRLTPG